MPVLISSFFHLTPSTLLHKKEPPDGGSNRLDQVMGETLTLDRVSVHLLLDSAISLY